MIELRKAICKVKIYTDEDSIYPEKGTGFFISENLILTSNHVIEKSKGQIEISKCHNQNEELLTANIIANCAECDYALLELNEEYKSEFILELCDSEIIEQENIRIFGYPNDNQGQDLGENLNGSIQMKADDSAESVQDVVLNISGFAHSSKYDAFSGSPVINDYGQVTSIIKYQAVRSLSSVSVKKALSFLAKNNIEVKPDQLQSFEAYSDVFSSFPEDIKTDCETKANNLSVTNKPNRILNSLEGNLFYPKKNKSITEIITELRKDKDLNNSLWKGWIKLLTYIDIIKGDFSDINQIHFNLSGIDIKELYGENITFNKQISIPLKLSFYFTEEKSYFQIARSFLPIKTNQQNNTCSIFNSSDEHFNLKKFTNSDKIKLVPNISGSIDSAFKIEDKISFGVLNLEALSSEIVNSDTLEEASKNIEKIFIDAIK